MIHPFDEEDQEGALCVANITYNESPPSMESDLYAMSGVSVSY
jgi:hypothetical protein